MTGHWLARYAVIPHFRPVKPDLRKLHRQVNVAAVLAGKSLNAFVTEQLQVAVQKIGVIKAAGKKVASKAKKAKAAKASPRRKKDIEQHA